jgi:hypothetical protein
MKNTFNPQIPQNIFLQQNHVVSSLRSRGDVRQDKSAALRGRVATAQPERPATVMRAHQGESQPSRIQNNTTDKRKTVPLALWVKPFVKAEVQRMVELEKHQGKEDVSLSSVGGAFLERGIQQNVDMKYGALLGPIIENAIDRRMRARDNRLVALLVRIAFETGQIRGIVTNNLAVQPGITEDIIQTVLTKSEEEAKKNIIRKTPQITEMLEDLSKWMTVEEEKKSPLPNGNCQK